MIMSPDSETEPSTRTLTSLVVKLITIHIITTANFVYASNLQGRRLKAGLSLSRVAFFVLAPSLCIAEIALNLIYTVVKLVKDESEDDDDIDVWFYLSAAMGMHALQRLSDGEEEDGEGGERSRIHERKSISLLHTNRLRCEREKYNIDWTWTGQILISLFTLAQGIGTILVWVQRIMENSDFGLDDRNALMAIATTALSIQTLTILYIRIKWTVSGSTSLPQSTGRNVPRTRLDRNFIHLACIALLIQASTRIDDIREDKTFAMPFMFVFWLIGIISPHMSIWLYLLFGFLVYLLRREISEKLHLSQARDVLGRRLRLGGFAYVLLLLLIVADNGTKLFLDVIVVLFREPQSHGGPFWEETSLSEAIPVL